MKWDMEVEEIEAGLEKIWDLHDKLNDAIHSISRAHFLNSIKSHNRNSQSPSHSSDDVLKKSPDVFVANGESNRAGFVYFKDFSLGVDADDMAAIQETKSLKAIRAALENLQEHLEFFHAVQTQQGAERDTVVARLEQSCLVLAMRLAEHQGKRYKVIEEAQGLVGYCRNASHLFSPEDLYTPEAFPGVEKGAQQKRKRSNAFINTFLSSCNFVKRSLKLDYVGGILGNAALVAISMLALMHLNQVGIKEGCIMDLPQRQGNVMYNQNTRKVSRTDGSSSGGRSTQLDVLLARG